ncbi:MAG: hypothetical protein CSA33_03280 [Desulfobulbus propionicus]|nr:MAG: hypothetical protein CSA33_03280 [Desulfobulbus propionicus]
MISLFPVVQGLGIILTMHIRIPEKWSKNNNAIMVPMETKCKLEREDGGTFFQGDRKNSADCYSLDGLSRNAHEPFVSFEKTYRKTKEADCREQA